MGHRWPMALQVLDIDRGRSIARAGLFCEQLFV
jgi:hypothetical protein